MNTPAQLTARLDAIGRSVAGSKHGLAVIGLGSVGIELSRIDQYSDLDFFVIVEDGSKQQYLENLDWLSSIAPISYYFQNTADGFKILYADGIFCEMAVFDISELEKIPFAEGRIVWKAVHINDGIRIPKCKEGRQTAQSEEWLLGEALTNIYVGLCRFLRGEKLSAARFVQGYALDRIVDLSARLAIAGDAPADVFMPERRYEQRYPDVAMHLPAFMQGYEKTPASARVMLDFLDSNFDINPAMKAEIIKLCNA